jgi:hypothetical protein
MIDLKVMPFNWAGILKRYHDATITTASIATMRNSEMHLIPAREVVLAELLARQGATLVRHNLYSR